MDKVSNHIQETFTIQASPGQPSPILTESATGDEYIMPRIEAIHAGRTKNFNHYLAEKLKGDYEKKSGVYSWTHPYNKPVIYNHDTDTKATGRIATAAYTDYTSAGKPGIVIIPKITDPEAVQAIKDGRLLTVSIGATTDSIICSITGKDILKEGFTGYQKGEYYDGVLCEWILGDIWFDEVSWVNVPADENAQIVDIQTSLFMNSDDTTESANRSLQEMFGVPKGIPIFVPELQKETDKNNKTAENVGQEEEAGMEFAEKELVVEQEELETPSTNTDDGNQTEAPEKDTPEQDNSEVETQPAGAEAPEVLADQTGNPEAGDIEDAEASEDNNSKVDTPEDEELSDEDKSEQNSEVTQDATAEADQSAFRLQQLVVENEGLKAQNDALVKELKENYISSIVQAKGITAEAKESYTKRLESRSLDSLRDTLLDELEEQANIETLTQKEEPRRTAPTKVNNPVKNKEETEKRKVEVSEQDKVAFLKSLLK